MAMLRQKGTVVQEGRFIKVTTYTTTKIYLINATEGKLQEIA